MVLPAIYTDPEIEEIARLMKKAEEENLFKTVKCCLIGAKCNSKHIVSVPVHPGFEHSPRNVDLYIDRYIEHLPLNNGLPKDLGRNTSCIRRYPPSSQREQRFQWTIFFEDQSSTIDPPLPRNELYDSFKCEDGRRNHYGNIAVVKGNRDGRVVDVEVEDLYFIEIIVYTYLEEISMRSRFPVLVRPVLERAKRKTTGWEAEPRTTWGGGLWDV